LSSNLYDSNPWLIVQISICEKVQKVSFKFNFHLNPSISASGKFETLFSFFPQFSTQSPTTIPFPLWFLQQAFSPIILVAQQSDQPKPQGTFFLLEPNRQPPPPVAGLAPQRRLPPATFSKGKPSAAWRLLSWKPKS
jgi:hypothetical protein